MTKEEFRIKWETKYKNLRPAQPLYIFLRFYWDEIFEDLQPFLEESAKEYNEQLLRNLVNVKDLNLNDR